MNRLASITRELLPPFAWRALVACKRGLSRIAGGRRGADLYWNESFADALETWGETSAWPEIELLLSDKQGRVLDIACGTGAVMERLKRFADLDVYGVDISSILVARARNKGLASGRALVADATQVPFAAGAFDYAYSIGSLEHFSEPDIDVFLTECARVASRTSFHHIPVSRSGRNEGWITPYQAYFNNSEQWWLERFQRAFPAVRPLASSWSDDRSVGRWFLCSHADGAGEHEHA